MLLEATTGDVRTGQEPDIAFASVIRQQRVDTSSWQDVEAAVRRLPALERQVTGTLLPDCAIKPPAAEAELLPLAIRQISEFCGLLSILAPGISTADYCRSETSSLLLCREDGRAWPSRHELYDRKALRCASSSSAPTRWPEPEKPEPSLPFMAKEQNAACGWTRRALSRKSGRAPQAADRGGVRYAGSTSDPARP